MLSVSGGMQFDVEAFHVRGVISARVPDSSVGGVPVGCCPDDDHMEEEVQSKERTTAQRG